MDDNLQNHLRVMLNLFKNNYNNLYEVQVETKHPLAELKNNLQVMTLNIWKNKSFKISFRYNLSYAAKFLY